MIKNKTILFSTLFLSWAIIFAHSIIPHNHHHESINDCKVHSHSINISATDFPGIGLFFSMHEHYPEDPNHCHFNISTTLTKFVDNPGTTFYAETIIVPILIKSQPLYTNRNDLLIKHFYFDSFSLRGPPAFS